MSQSEMTVLFFEGVWVPNDRHLCLRSVCALGRRIAALRLRPVGGGLPETALQKYVFLRHLETV